MGKKKAAESTPIEAGRFATVIGQMAALAGFMYCDGREAFELLSPATRANLHALFDELNAELQQLTVNRLEISND